MTELPASMQVRSWPLANLAKVWSACLSLAACQAFAQVPATTESPTASVPVVPENAASSAAVPNKVAPLKPWHSLNQRQKQALAPLSVQWENLTAPQQRKWLTIANNFLQLTDEEQMTMHSRMIEWAGLSTKERNQARFNFNSAMSLPIDDKRAQWEAYQSLPEKDKLQLSSGPKPPAKSAARTTLTASSRLVSPPTLPVISPKAIARVAPSQPVDPKTLLPKPAQP